MLEYSEALALAQHANEVDLLYFDPTNRLLLRRANNTEQVLSQGEDGDARRAYATLHSDGQALYALWRPKLTKAIEGVGGPGAKLVYFRASLDGGNTFGSVQRLNRKDGAFQPVIASSGQGDVYVAWTDERNSGNNIDIYLNSSRDHGGTWLKEDIKINGSESLTSLNPTVVADGNRAYVSWMTVDKDRQFKIFVRSTEDRGTSWLPPVTVNISMAQPATPTLVKTATGLLMCWGSADAVRCSSSVDHGKSWSNSAALEDSKGTEGLILAADPKGHAHLLIAKKPRDEKSALNLLHAISMGGEVFGPLQRISGGMPYKSTTTLPRLTFGDDGSALAVWVDMRYVMPVIAANYSADGGKTWLAENLVLAGKKGLFQLFPAVSYAGKGKYSVAWQETPKRSNPGTVIGRVEYFSGFPGVSMPRPDPARLKERTNAFWSLREAAKFDQIYDLLDPYFHEINSRKGYAASQGSAIYFSHRLTGEPEISGNRATIKVTYDSEVPELMLSGKKVSVPRQEVEIEQEWVWVNGDWFQVFRDLFGGSAIPN